MPRILPRLLALTVLGCSVSCASSVFTNYPDDAWIGLDAFQNGEFSYAADEFSFLEGTRGSNEFLAHAEAGMAYHVGGELEKAIDEWLTALDVVDGYAGRPTISGRTVGEGALSMLVNDKTIPYDGEGFEIVLLHAFLAWDYLRLGQLSDALVEVKRGYEFEQLEQERYGNTYGMNRFGRFVAALAQDMDGQYDEALIDLNRLAKDLPDHPVVKYSLARIKRLRSQQRAKELSRSELIVVFEVGHMPEKVATEFTYNTNRSIGKISIPKFGPSSSTNTRKLQVRLDNRLLGRTQSLENVLQVGRANLDDRIGWVTTKAFGRSIGKTLIVDKVAEKAEEKHGEWAGILVGVAGSILNTLTESADLRSWLTLPKDIQVLRTHVQPGEHQIQLVGPNNSTIDLGIYSFEAGSPVLLNVRAIGQQLFVHPRPPSQPRP